jgi:hypothetical protein
MKNEKQQPEKFNSYKKHTITRGRGRRHGSWLRRIGSGLPRRLRGRLTRGAVRRPRGGLRRGGVGGGAVGVARVRGAGGGGVLRGARRGRGGGRHGGGRLHQHHAPDRHQGLADDIDRVERVEIQQWECPKFLL